MSVNFIHQKLILSKKIKLFILISGLLFIFPVLIAQARENVSDWYIQDFNTEIVVQADSSVIITERIVADCGQALGKHGIFRALPLRHQTVDGAWSTPVEVFSVTDFTGKNYRYQKTTDNQVLTLKIGDPQVTVRGVNNYLLNYQVKNAVSFSEETANGELYWNILGNFWELEIDNFSAKIIFPEGFKHQESEIFVYAGKLNASQTANNLDNSLFALNWLSDNTLLINSQRIILPGEGITLSVIIPQGLVSPDELNWKPVSNNFFVGQNLLTKVDSSSSTKILSVFTFINLLVVLIVAIFLFKLVRRYQLKFPRKKTIIPEFLIPDNLSPLEMAKIYSLNNLSPQAITASIVNLGVKGYLKMEIKPSVIKLFPSSYKLIKTDKEMGDDLYSAEKTLLEELFKNRLEVGPQNLKNKFYLTIAKIDKEVSADLIKRELLSKKKKNLKTVLTISAILTLFAIGPIALTFLFLAVPIIGIMLGVAAWKINSRTESGAELDWRIKCFLYYLKTAEKYRSQFNEKEGIMEKYLPYAILFGLTKEWLKKMKDIYGEPYVNNYQSQFLLGATLANNINLFASSIESVSRQMSSHVAPSSSGSGGGGSSGGGSGGGGGGGW